MDTTRKRVRHSETPTVDRCAKCGKGRFLTQVLPRFEDTQLGIPGVTLINAAEETVCAACGTRYSIAIPDLAGLIRAVAVARIKNPLKLSGAEIRFLRSAAELSGTELATLLEVRKETVSRWENAREPIGPTSEKLLRVAIGLRLAKEAPGVDFDPRAVTDMAIQAVRPTRATLAMALERVKLPRRKVRAWGDVEAA